MRKLFGCFSRKAKRRQSEAPKVPVRPLESMSSTQSSQQEFGRQDEEYIGETFVPQKQKLGPSPSTNTYIVGPNFDAPTYFSGNDHDRHNLSNKESFKSIGAASYWEGEAPQQRRPLSGDDEVFNQKADESMYWTG